MCSRLSPFANPAVPPLPMTMLALQTLPAAAAPTDAQPPAFRGYRLQSAFQPIFSLTHRRVVGYEGLLRARNAEGEPVSPLEVFAAAEDTAETVELDRACRALHARAFAPLRAEPAWLFLNINPRVVVQGRRHGSFFADLLQRSGLEPSQVVVEILESAIQDEALLAATVAYYRELGCLVALDDFGSGSSNFDRVLRLRPDIVKLDRALVRDAAVDATASRLLPNLVALLHESGCLVVCEGIENEAEALAAMASNCDFVQGYYFARPGTLDAPLRADPALFSGLDAAYARRSEAVERTREQALAPYHFAFEQAAAMYLGGAAPEGACERLLNRPGVLRCYLLDEQGIQLGSSLVPAHAAGSDRRFSPLEDSVGADWSRKPYFRSAVGRTGVVHVTRPYFSVTGAELCVTLSMGVWRGEQLQVLCCDVAAAP